MVLYGYSGLLKRHQLLAEHRNAAVPLEVLPGDDFLLHFDVLDSLLIVPDEERLQIVGVKFLPENLHATFEHLDFRPPVLAVRQQH